ncbi:MAG: replication-relaxation family protein [Firmicutes bacterium]|nr:replication-relaxation family protein [Bacillota bacterium]
MALPELSRAAPRPEPESPFSASPDWELMLSRPPKPGGVARLASQITRRDLAAAKDLSIHVCLTGVQLEALHFKGVSRKTARERLGFLSRAGFLLRHALVNKNARRAVPFYTLGPLGAESLNLDFDPRSLRQLTPAWVARLLSASQLWLRLSRIDHADFEPGDRPFAARIRFRELDFDVASVRSVPGDAETAVRELSWIDQGRIIVVAASRALMLQVAGGLPGRPVRYTTDRDLFASPLHLAFYAESGGEVSRVDVPLFKE